MCRQIQAMATIPQKRNQLTVGAAVAKDTTARMQNARAALFEDAI